MTNKELFTISRRPSWAWLGEIKVEIECDLTAPHRIKLGLAVKAAFSSRGAGLSDAILTGAILRSAILRSADLTGADLSGAILCGAILTGAILRSAILRSADLTGADLTGAILSDAPKIENIHQTVYAAASQLGALKMSTWHCGTSHCRAGWVVTLAGEESKSLEDQVGTPAAATMIYLASDPTIEQFPNFYCDDQTALEDMKRMAEAEAARGVQ